MKKSGFNRIMQSDIFQGTVRYRFNALFVLMMLCAAMMCLWLVFSGPVAAGDAEEKVSSEPKQAVYVTDFELDFQQVEEKEGPVRNLLKKPRGGQKDPAVRAREMVDLMAESLVKELNKRGYNAQRLADGTPTPKSGVLVRGVFAQVGEGNRLRRAVIGFGAAKTDVQALVTVDDLSQGMPQPLFELEAGKASKRMPGAVITMNPYVAAAKFVIAGKDLDKNITKAAAQIADEIKDKTMKGSGQSTK